MANKQTKQPKPAVSFDDIIKSDRQKKKHQQLASELLVGKNRRSSAPGPGAVQKSQAAKPGSLASRIGPKRSVSATARPKKATQTLAPVASARSQPPQKNKRSQNQKGERLLAAIESVPSQANVRGPGLSIKGASGPFIVIGSNFAPGTTAADIQSSFEPISGPMISCRVTSHHPVVTAEFAYADKWTAENVVANFHNQKADGRHLSMTLGSASNDQNSYDKFRQQADRERLSRRAGPSVQDGSYGFGQKGDLLRNDNSSALFSDSLMVDAPRHQNRRRGQ